MKTKKHIAKLLAAAILLANAAIPYNPLKQAANNLVEVYAETTEDGAYEYTVNGDAVTITAYKGTDTSITLPRIIDGKSVTTIGYKAFKDQTALESIILPEGLLTIDKGAFYNCKSLTSLKIPDSVTDIYSDFYNSTGNARYSEPTFGNCILLATVEFGSGLKAIPIYAFQGCTALETVILGKNIETIGDYAFTNSTWLENIDFSITKLVTIGSNAFENCPFIEKVIFPSTLETIGYKAFKDCVRLGDVRLNDGLVAIGKGAFYNCQKIKNIVIPDSVTYIGSDFYNSTSSARYTEQAFGQCTALTTFTFGAGVETIDPYLFRGCTALETVNLTKSIKTIDIYAFENTLSLKNIDLSITQTATIGEGAFQNCPQLESVTFPETLKTIGYKSFKDDVGITEVNFNEGLEIINKGAFFNLPLITNIVIPDSVTYIGSDFYNSTSSARYTEQAFGLCTALTTFTFGAGVETIDPYLFRGCTALETVNLTKSIKTIDIYAFANTLSLKYIDLSITQTATIGEGAFQNCPQITRVVCPPTLNTIGYKAFKDCTSLTSIEFNDNLRTIDKGAFFNCKNLVGVNIPDKVTLYSDWYNSTGSSRYTEPTFGDCTSLLYATFGSKILGIPAYIFRGSTNLETVIIPDNYITSIDAAAFTGLPNLTIYGETGGFANGYADAYSIPFLSLDQAPDYSPIPVVTKQPLSLKANLDGNATLTVFATGESLSYQWYKNGVAIDGATKSTYKAVTSTLNVTPYYCKVTNTAPNARPTSVATYTVTVSVELDTEIPRGDVNNDTYYTLDDIIYLRRYLANWDEYKTIDYSSADLGRDDTINISDLIALRHFILNG